MPLSCEYPDRPCGECDRLLTCPEERCFEAKMERLRSMSAKEVSLAIGRYFNRKALDLVEVLRGRSLVEAAKETGLSISTVKGYRVTLRRLGLLPKRKSRVGQIDLEEFRRLWEAGVPVREIAEKYGISPHYAYNIASARGWRRPEPPEVGALRLLASLNESGPSTTRELAERLGTSVGAIRHLMLRLERHGLVAAVRPPRMGHGGRKYRTRVLFGDLFRGNANIYYVPHNSLHLERLAEMFKGVVPSIPDPRLKAVYTRHLREMGLPGEVLEELERHLKARRPQRVPVQRERPKVPPRGPTGGEETPPIGYTRG